MILVVSHPDDDHASAVRRHLDERGHAAVMFDTGSFPGHAAVAIGFDGAAPDVSLRIGDGEAMDLSACRAVWWRRPRPFTVPGAVNLDSARAFAYAECHEAIAGLWRMLDASWVNEPANNDAAAKKPYQLLTAQAVGLAVPRMLITNDAAAAREFVATLGAQRTVYKAFTATEQVWRETRVMRPEELALLDRVALAPVIFQEYVPAVCDLRVTIVGHRVFAAAVSSQQTRYEVDYRLELETVSITPRELPSSLEAAILRLMERLGLSYGAIDLRLTPDGDYIFLEINPGGQWLFVEHRTGQAITRAVANLLVEHDRGRGDRFGCPSPHVGHHR